MCKTMLQLSLVLVLLACQKPCGSEIEIYRGPVFKSGQSYSVKIEDEVVVDESFLFGVSTGEYTWKADYCCHLDSCKVTFTLDDRDTVFYVNPSVIHKFIVGSDYRRRHSVATNLDSDAWTIM
jgi:hypothetical protein